MKRIVYVSFLSVLLVLLAEKTGWSQEKMKVGYVDIQLAMTTIDQGKRESEKIKKELEAKKKKFDALEDELKKLKDDFDKQAPMMKEDVRMKKQMELQGKYEEYQKTAMSLQKEASDKQNNFIKEIFGKMKVVIEKIGDRDNYTMILDRNEANVLYFKRHMDITDEVVKMYNSQYK